MKSLAAALLALSLVPSNLDAQGRPDLACQSVSLSPGRIQPGGTVFVTAAVRNVGTWGTAESWVDTIWWNTQPGHSGRRPLATLPWRFPNFILPGQSYGPSRFPVTLPTNLPCGPIYIGYEANSGRSTGWAIPERDYGNNTRWIEVQIRRPDLSVTGVAIDQPQPVTPGALVQLAARIENVGSWGTAVRWSDRVWFNTERSTGGAQPLTDLPWSFPAFILPGQSYGPGQPGLSRVSVRIPASAADGVAYVGYEANHSRPAAWAIGECERSNNIFWLPIDVDGQPDHVVEVPRPSAALVPGVSIPIGLTSRNQGGNLGNAPSVTRVSLSLTPFPNPSISASTAAVVIGRRSARHDTVTLTIPAGLGAGNYFLVVEADSSGDVFESDENNNRTTLAVQVGPQPLVQRRGIGCPGSNGSIPDLDTASTPRAGQTFTLDVTRAPRFAAGYLLFGVADDVALDPIGATGCRLLIGSPITDPPAGFVGSWSLGYALPLQLFGVQFHVQAVHFDQGANRLGVITSNALRVVVGR